MHATGLHRRRILVIGAQGGIGAAVVEVLRRADVTVMEADRELGFDVVDADGAGEAIDHAVASFGGLDGVVHAVGMSGRSQGDGPPASCTDQAWHEVLDVNLTSAFRVVRVAMPAMSPGGSIVIVGSVLAETTDKDFLTTAYAVSKGGLRSLVRVAARAGAPDDVRVNLVSPGLVDTPMAARALHDDSAISRRLPELHPLGQRPVAPTEVANGIAWLLSSSSGAVTGTDLVIDRGWSL